MPLWDVGSVASRAAPTWFSYIAVLYLLPFVPAALIGFFGPTKAGQPSNDCITPAPGGTALGPISRLRVSDC